MLDGKVDKVPSTSTLVDPTSSSWARPVLTNARLAVELRTDLMNMDEVFKDQDLALILLGSLPDKYELLKTTLLNGKDDVSLCEVCVAMYTKELRRKDKQNSSSGDAEVLLVRGRSQKKGTNKRWRSKSRQRLSKDECAFFHEKADETLLTTHGIGSVRLQNEDGTIVTLKAMTYAGEKSLNLLIKQGLLKGLSSCKLDLCEHCINGNMTRVKFRTAIHKTTRIWVCTLKTKDGVLGVFIKWKKFIEIQTCRKIKHLQTDNGGEYKNDLSIKFCEDEGIVRNFTLRHTPQQNGVAERMNRTLLEKVRNQTWELTNLLEGNKEIGCKWVYAKKEGFPCQDDVHYKVRLVAKDYAQKEGIDYNEIFSLVVKYSSIRILLALVALLHLELVQMDVKTAFLHGNLEEEIYMVQQEGFKVAEKEHEVCKLHKSLCGLKQSPRHWYKRFDKFMMESKYIRSKYDHCVYLKRLQDGSFISLLLYVDDTSIASQSLDEIEMLKTRLKRKFEMKDLGEAKMILGMEIQTKRVSTPLAFQFKISAAISPKNDAERAYMEKVPYVNVVGSLMYAMLCIRPDISHDVEMVNMYMHNPGKGHWQAVKWILRYIHNTVDVGLVFEHRSSQWVEGYYDSDYAGDLDKSRVYGDDIDCKGANLALRIARSKIVTCVLCKNKGHNKRSCKGIATSASKKKNNTDGGTKKKRTAHGATGSNVAAKKKKIKTTIAKPSQPSNNVTGASDKTKI
nr:retrovirus-related Pol polyprotein from transposon TNT 1-94 [Tanacetum cinerariifolium]